MTYNYIDTFQDGPVLWIYLSYPQKKNALIVQMKDELEQEISKVKKDHNTRALIVTGKDEAFCAGGDIQTMGKDLKTRDGLDRMQNLHGWLVDFIMMEKPVIAAVNGPAVGAGFGLALCCDIIISSNKAKYGALHNRVGLIPDAATLFFLPRYIGLNKAKEMILKEKLINAEEAYNLGIVNQIVEQKELEEEVSKIAHKMANSATMSLGISKRIMNMSYETNLTSLLQMEAYCEAILFQTEDHREGKDAFLNKRKPIFKGF